MTGLRRLILTIKPDGHELRVPYSRQDGPNPQPQPRRREVELLASGGLERALEALKEGPVECIGTAGFETREDTLSLEASPFLPKQSSNCLKKGGR